MPAMPPLELNPVAQNICMIPVCKYVLGHFRCDSSAPPGVPIPGEGKENIGAVGTYHLIFALAGVVQLVFALVLARSIGVSVSTFIG